MLTTYRPGPDSFDEAYLGDGRPRPAWADLLGALDSLGADELARRRADVVRLLQADGVTYNVYGDPSGAHRAWELDPIPLVIASDEWARIESGVIERAELLNAVLVDLYGPRDLLRHGVIPPELVFAHRGFLRQVDGALTPVRQPLATYAVDLARTPDGAVVALNDFTQAPSGVGYALQNRNVISRVFPSLYRYAQVHRLAPFFRTLRSSLAAVAPVGADDPRVVLLSPGPQNETYFEHAFLARNLGYTLVEGPDLTMHEGRIWLRSLSGLEQVDVVLRRVDGWYCDPLELKPDSKLGVPGLVEACRIGSVTVANAIGTSVLENPGLAACLPQVARHLLGRELSLAGVSSWWCGDPDARRYVLDNLASLVVKPIARTQGRQAVFGATLSAEGLDLLRARIEQRPHQFVAQEVLTGSSAPTMTSTVLEPRRTLLRAFAAVRGDSYEVMPGGLTRVSSSADQLLVSNQAGAPSKDTWVLASEPEPQTSFWLSRGPTEAIAPAGALAARTAENLFWLGRYAERAEQTVRLLRAVLDRRNDFQFGSSTAGATVLRDLLVALVTLSGHHHDTDLLAAQERVTEVGPVLRSCLQPADAPGTLAFDLRATLECANAVRDQLSGDTWLALGELESALGHLERGTTDLHASIDAAVAPVMRGLLAFEGLAAESMVRDPGWAFMDAGRRLERGLRLLALLELTVVEPRDTAAESLMLESVLVAAESIITYRRRYRSHAQVETLLDLLLLDGDNPRALAYQVAALGRALDSLARPVHTRLPDDSRQALELDTQVRVLDTVALAKTDASGRRDALAAFFAEADERLRVLASTIEAGHFAQVLPGQSLLSAELDETDWDEVLQ